MARHESRSKWGRPGQHRARGPIAALAVGPAPGRHRATVPSVYRLFAAVILFVVAAPVVTTMLPRPTPASEFIEAKAVGAMADTEISLITVPTASTTLATGIAEGEGAVRPVTGRRDGPNPASGERATADNPHQQSQQQQPAASSDTDTAPPLLIAPSRTIIVRSIPTTTTTTTPILEDFDFWDFIIGYSPPVAESTTTTVPLEGDGSTTTTSAPTASTTSTAPPSSATTTTMNSTTTSSSSTTSTSVPPATTTTTTPKTGGVITVTLLTNPPSSPTGFMLLTSYGSPVELFHADSVVADVPAAEHSISLEMPPGWDGIGDCIRQSDAEPFDPSLLPVADGDAFACTFEVVQRGRVLVLKTESGDAPGAPFTFEIREGSSPDEPGEVIATGLSDPAGAVTFTCASDSDVASCSESTPAGPVGASFPPGLYQVCETSVMPGWFNDLEGFIPAEGDGSTICDDVPVAPGTLTTVAVDNTPPPGGFAHPPAFWRTWSSCAAEDGEEPVLDETLAQFSSGLQLGDVVIGDCEDAVHLLGGNALDGTHRETDAAYRLVAELLAAALNEQAGALTCEESAQALDGASELLNEIGFDGAGWFLDSVDDPYSDPAVALMETVRLYNINQLCERPEDDAVPDLLVPFLIWPALLIAGRVERRRHGGGTAPGR